MIVIQLTRDIEEVVVERWNIVPAESRPDGLWVAENGRLGRLGDYEWTVRVVHGDERDVEVSNRAFATGVIPTDTGHGLEIGPGHVIRIHPVLRIEHREWVADIVSAEGCRLSEAGQQSRRQ